MPSAVDVHLAARFHAQHHVISRRQALEAGCTPRMIGRRLASGAWVAVAPGAYRPAGAPPSWRADALAACFQLGAAASHQAAAGLHGLAFAPPPVAVVTTARGASNRTSVARVHHTRCLPVDHLTVVDAIPATTVARTIVDLAAVVRPAQLDRLLEEAILRRQVRFDEVDEAFGATARRGRRGTAAMRAVLAQRGPGLAMPESELERRLLAVVRRAGLPEPVRQASLPGAGVEGRVDLSWPAARLVVEGDGRRWHARHLAFELDRARDRRMVLAAWRVLRFDWRDLVVTPDLVAAEIGAALAAAPRTDRG